MRNSNGMMINDDVLAGNETLHQRYELSFLVLALRHVNARATFICITKWESNTKKGKINHAIQFYSDQTLLLAASSRQFITRSHLLFSER